MRFRSLSLLAVLAFPLAVRADLVQEVYRANTDPPFVVGNWLVRGLGDTGQATNDATDYIIWGTSSPAHASKIPSNPPYSSPPPPTPKDGTPTYTGSGYITVAGLRQYFGSLGGGKVLDDFSIYVAINEAQKNAERPIKIDNIAISLINYETGIPYFTHQLDAWGVDRGARLMDGVSGASASDFELSVNAGLHLANARPEDIVRFDLGMSELSAGGEFLWAANPRHLVGEFDCGDAPDSYQTLLESYGPCHAVGDFEWLGNLWDKESNGQPTADATGDDANGLADEDGVVYDAGSASATLTVSDWASGRYSADPSQKLYLDGWLDWDNDGTFAEAKDHIVAAHEENPAIWGSNSKTVAFSIPGFIPKGEGSIFRWRLSYGYPTSFAGYAYFGEVVDNRVTPEPASALLLAGGLLALVRRRRK